MRFIDLCFCLLLVFGITGCAPAPLLTEPPASTPTGAALLVTEALPPTPTRSASPTAGFTAAPPTPDPAATRSQTPEAAPALRAGQWASLFYHDGLGQVVLVNGGPESGKRPDEPLELWGWDGAEWTLIEAGENGPTWRNWAAVVFDQERDVLVIHGGEQNRRAFDETWEWDGRSWTKFTGAGPGARTGALMAYDEARRRTVLFGGAAGEIDAQTWEWDGQAWTMVAESGPGPRFPAGMVYDPVRQEILMYSGHYAAPSGEARNYDDLWAWDGGAWRELAQGGAKPGHHAHAPLVFNPQTERILLFSGGMDAPQGSVWAWNEEQWTELEASDNMPARSGSSVAYDANRGIYVFFSGVDRPGGTAIGDTWEWDGNQWMCASNCP